MATSYKDITGPVTVLSTFTLKHEFADRVAQYMADDIANQTRLAREGKLPGLISIEGVRFGDSFASWERYTDAGAVERVIPVRYKIFKDLPLAEAFSEPPNIQFFGTNSLPPPQS
ncbi:uncharacterized protein FOMMEDRAFT_31094 [Fomitiporia mediterranea MF3/22]|uniref:uncharacterized protein n=1 Tax=Fomitiporia mediterranea (strain MF3/22) TaxID=694068 RepID=UPI0004409C59|nr:uncharacterized protein FOMMEDRAFT_31094 [Fomitiporia mediterranea MF3/22]EJC99846.1 hypothetical protein FOMMEDRAFT_31094 [Fomitiporia mediterranea MF3/22]